MYYLVWDKYLETSGIMFKDFEANCCTIDTVEVTSSFYSMVQETEVSTKHYWMKNAEDMKRMEDRYKVIKEY